jgi:hypothetical protein
MPRRGGGGRRSKGRSGGSKGRYRSAISGRYVTAKHGRRSRRTTVRESSSKGRSRGVRYRSAITGRYVSAATARRHPNTTVAEQS